MTREIQREVFKAYQIAGSRAKRNGCPEDRGLITAQVIAQRIFPEEGIDYLTHPLAKHVNKLVDHALQAEDFARSQGKRRPVKS